MTKLEQAYSKMGQIVAFVISICLGGIGIFILTRTIAVEDIGIWIGPMLILAGVSVLSTSGQSKPEGYVAGPAQPKPRMTIKSTSMIIALILLFTGIFIILRQVGVINTPWLQYIIGGGFVLFGIWGSLTAGYRLFSQTNSPR